MKKILAISLALFVSVSAWAGEKKSAAMPEMDQAMMQKMVQASIQKFKINDDVSVEDAIDSMMLRANTLNFKLVAEDLQPLALKVRDTIYSIVDAGVNGDL